MLTTTPTALLLIKAFEGFKNQTYFDSAGIPTIGFGTTRFQNGDKVALGDEITEDEAEAELFYHIRREVEPALTRLFEGLALQPNQRDALASFMYNLGGSGDKWPTLKRLIQEGAPSDKIADQWMKYHRAGGNKVLGLFRRRMAEVLVWLGWAWDKAFNAVQNVEMDQDWRGVAGYQDAAPDVDAELFDELEIPKRGTDPTPETPMTMDDAQYLSAQAVGYEGSYADWIGHRVVVSKRNAIEAPNLYLKADPKAVEDSETGRGYAKEVSGKDDVRLAAIATGASTTAAVASGLSKDVSTAMENTRTIVAGATVMQLVTIGLIIGIPFMLYGLWKIYRGRDIKEEGRAIATQPKV